MNKRQELSENSPSYHCTLYPWYQSSNELRAENKILDLAGQTEILIVHLMQISVQFSVENCTENGYLEPYSL